MLSILRHLSVTAVLIWIEKLWFVYCWSGKLIAWYVDAFLACKEGGYREKWRASGTRNETEEREAGLPLTRTNYLPSNKVDIVRSHAQVARFRRHASEGWVCHLLGRSLFSPQARRYREKSHARGAFKETEERGAGFPLTRITYLPTSKGDIARSSLGVHFLATSIIPFAKRNGELARRLMCIQKCHLHHIRCPDARYLQ